MPTFPSSPVNGDIYQFTAPTSKNTKYIFNSKSSTWEIIEVTLPSLVIQSRPAEFSFLPEYPADKEIVYGPDNLTYYYNGNIDEWVAYEYLVEGRQHGKIIPDIKNYLKCLSTSQKAQVTIYVDQPVANSTATYDWSDVGHAWFSITQTVNGTTYTRMIGFYPDGFVIPGSPNSQGQLKDDSGRNYDVSVTMDLSVLQIQSLLSYILSPTPDYNLNSFSCVNYLVTGFSKMNINLPQTKGTWPGGGGLNPGNFGQDMRNYSGNYSSKNTNGGICPSIQGICN